MKARSPLIDTSLQFGDVDILFNEVGQLSLLDLTPIAYELDPKGRQRSDDLAPLPPVYTCWPLPNGPLLQEPITGEQISRVLDYVRSFYDYRVINTSNYINEATLASLDLADVIVLVITQEIASIKSMRSFLELWDGFGMKRERLMLVVNKFNKNGRAHPQENQ